MSDQDKTVKITVKDLKRNLGYISEQIGKTSRALLTTAVIGTTITFVAGAYIGAHFQRKYLESINSCQQEQELKTRVAKHLIKITREESNELKQGSSIIQKAIDNHQSQPRQLLGMVGIKEAEKEDYLIEEIITTYSPRQGLRAYSPEEECTR